ncbi:aldehyde dehydrogenase [Nocardia terpenica]|uniref:Aldehyde dehydrogenase n=1 Tax=Nocardia terpenica TaxID=455432 RepID=A0A164LPK4_9NOCA|nr:aldehyde dehydrogenase [Nocardia terpenica]KZM72635.1 aldehyde dehydrogenase [Nocardia terpenica]NQE92476.1 aldehyde dehydrogenase [Nocardia terpenica]
MTAIETVSEHPRLFIGGRWTDPIDATTADIVNPATEEKIAEVAVAGVRDAEVAVAAARTAFDDPDGWSEWEPVRRAAALERLAEAFENRAGEIAAAVARQNGMPITLANVLEANFPPLLLRYYSDLIRTTPTSVVRAGLLGGRVEVRQLPLGAVTAIVPWNYPQTLAAMKYAPALAAGCSVVVKPAPQTVLDSIILAECLDAAGIPDGVVNIVPGGPVVGRYLVSHPDVGKVAFTGSTAVGREIARTCGDLLRPVTLELGGKSAAIVLDDAQLQDSIESLFGAIFLNNGQTCFLSSRILAPRRRYDEIVDLIAGLATGASIGDPLDPGTMIGPMVTAEQRARVESYIAAGKASGGRLVAGGGRPDRAGFFVHPTVFADVDNGHAIAREEIFGPVLVVIPYEDEDNAIRIANDSEYGLGGTVWSADADHAAAVARRVRTGTIGINGYTPDPAGPFGGFKHSGVGREFSAEGFANYVQHQTIYLG